MRTRASAVTFAAVMAAWAFGAIEEWGHDPAAQYVIEPVSQKVWIYAPATYKFQSVTAGQLENIQLIKVDPSCPAGIGSRAPGSRSARTRIPSRHPRRA